MTRAREEESPRRLPVAIFVDVDGTLAGPYRQGRRELRPSAREALAMLSGVAPVFLWSIVGAENGTRLLREFPELRPYVNGCYGKLDFPLDTVERSSLHTRSMMKRWMSRFWPATASVFATAIGAVPIPTTSSA